jgi:hypothetical protein
VAFRILWLDTAGEPLATIPGGFAGACPDAERGAVISCLRVLGAFCTVVGFSLPVGFFGMKFASFRQQNVDFVRRRNVVRDEHHELHLVDPLRDAIGSLQLVEQVGDRELVVRVLDLENRDGLNCSNAFFAVSALAIRSLVRGARCADRTPWSLSFSWKAASMTALADGLAFAVSFAASATVADALTADTAASADTVALVDTAAFFSVKVSGMVRTPCWLAPWVGDASRCS